MPVKIRSWGKYETSIKCGQRGHIPNSTVGEKLRIIYFHDQAALF